MIRILVDETVIADYVGERQPYCACWDKLNALELVGYAQLWTAPDAYRVMSQSLAEVLPGGEVARSLVATLDFIKVCSVDGSDVIHALGCADDYHRGILDACARKMKADYVVSRCVDKMPTAHAPVFTPEGLFEHLEESEGLVFDLVDL